MNKNTWLAVIVVLGVLIIIGAYYLFTTPVSVPLANTSTATTTETTATTTVATTASPTPDTSAAPASTKYSNPTLGFTFRVPTDDRGGVWKVIESDSTHVQFVDAIPDYGGESNQGSDIAVSVNSGARTIASLEAAEQSTHKGEVVFLGTKDFTLAGEPAFIEQYDGMAPVDIIYVIHGGFVYKISGKITDYLYPTNDVSFSFLK